MPLKGLAMKVTFVQLKKKKKEIYHLVTVDHRFFKVTFKISQC